MHGLESLERLYLCMNIVVYLVIKNEIHPYSLLLMIIFWKKGTVETGYSNINFFGFR